ncbi:MAG: phosphoglycerate kinase [Desulfobacteraceae bacterium]|nr:MAG: phosphoglycerate kinase [Desulfobacteraceae bacterium]
MAKLSVEDIQIKGKRILMRVDFNVPLRGGKVVSDQRIKGALPTIRYISDQGGKLILMSHLGRPKGKPVTEMSLKPCVSVLSEMLRRKVEFAESCIGPAAEAAVKKLNEGDVLLLENLRFSSEEEKNDPDFSAKLAALGDMYVNDAFGTAHRAHASTVGVTRHFRQCAAGYLMMKELDYLGKALENPNRPFVAIMGGAKISGKIDVISNLLPKVDKIIIGGGMSYTFFKAKGLEIGKSLLEEDRIAAAGDLLKTAGDKLILPVDTVVTDSLDFGARKVGGLRVVASDSISSGDEGVDIGPGSIQLFKETLKDAETVVWNGPMGVFEIDETAKGTYAVARILAEITDRGAVTIIGGGDSASAVENAGVAARISHVSTGGGASLEFLEGKVLPGVAALTDR